MFERLLADWSVGSGACVLHSFGFQIAMARQFSSLSMLVFLLGVHHCVGGDARVGRHDVIDVHMEEPAHGSFGMPSEFAPQEVDAPGVDGVPLPASKFQFIFERQQKQAAEIAKLYNEAMSFSSASGGD